MNSGSNPYQTNKMTDKLHTSRNSPNGAALLLAQPKELATQGWVKQPICSKSEEQRDHRRLVLRSMRSIDSGNYWHAKEDMAAENTSLANQGATN